MQARRRQLLQHTAVGNFAHPPIHNLDLTLPKHPMRSPTHTHTQGRRALVRVSAAKKAAGGAGGAGKSTRRRTEKADASEAAPSPPPPGDAAALAAAPKVELDAAAEVAPAALKGGGGAPAIDKLVDDLVAKVRFCFPLLSCAFLCFGPTSSCHSS